MTHALIAGKSGWTKSWFTQLYCEENLDGVDYAIILDFCDEYRGLAKAGMAKWMGVGDQEATIGPDGWRAALKTNEKLIAARKGLRPEEWRDVVADVVEAARSLDGEVLIVIDEAHFVAPQAGSYPEVIEGIATTGRGEGVSSIWVTQRLARLDETVIAQMMLFIIGGFRSDADLSKVGSIVEYPVDVHNPAHTTVHGLPEELKVDGEPLALRKFTDENGSPEGAEWVRSDDAGNVERVSTQGMEMESTHYGSEGHSLEHP